MSPQPLVPGLYLLDLGAVNAYLIDHEGLTLIDTGNPGDGPRILAAMATLGHAPQDLDRIIITHHHPDHAGSAAELKAATGAPVMAHRDDAELMAQGIAKRAELSPSPGLLNRILFRFLLKNVPTEIAPCEADETWLDDQQFGWHGGLQVIHTPGHTAGHLSLLWQQHGGVLLAADVAVNIPKLRYHPGYESYETGRQSLRRLANLEFAVATFGHGRPLLSNADQNFAQAFGI